MYIAQHFRKGRLIFQGQPFEGRLDAAAYLFRNCPVHALECSTCVAYRDHEGNWRPGHLRIEHHKRHDHFRDPAPVCDIGMFGDQTKQAELF